MQGPQSDHGPQLQSQLVVGMQVAMPFAQTPCEQGPQCMAVRSQVHFSGVTQMPVASSNTIPTSQKQPVVQECASEHVSFVTWLHVYGQEVLLHGRTTLPPVQVAEGVVEPQGCSLHNALSKLASDCKHGPFDVRDLVFNPPLHDCEHSDQADH